MFVFNYWLREFILSAFANRFELRCEAKRLMPLYCITKSTLVKLGPTTYHDLSTFIQFRTNRLPECVNGRSFSGLVLHHAFSSKSMKSIDFHGDHI